MIFDRIVKLKISASMVPGQEINVIDGFFSITYVRNEGAAFGVMAGNSMFLIAIPVILLLAMMIYIVVKRNEIHRVMGFSLSLIISGGLGNLIDRVLYGYVVDFLDFKIWSPVFNIADICVCVGCGLVIIYVLFEARKES